MASYYGYEDSARESWFSPPTPMMRRLLIINGIVFALQVFVVAFGGKDLYERTLNHFLGLSGAGLNSFMVWQPVTYIFLHNPFTPWHILFNCFFLWMFGRDVEHDLGPIGFLKLYLLSGVLGGVLWVAFNFNNPGVLGASGAVWGVCIAYATLYPDRVIRIWFILAVKAKYWAMFAVALELYYSLMFVGPVANLAHLGGMAVGYLFIKWCGYGQMPGWMAAIQGMLPSGKNRQPNPNDEYHSSRPGVPYNHPYRTLEEEEERKTATKKKGMFGKIIPSRSEASEPEEVDKDEYIQKEIDPILDKIAKQGMQSLTRRERKILESAKDKIDKRK